jgi:hypothetical protein
VSRTVQHCIALYLCLCCEALIFKHHSARNCNFFSILHPCFPKVFGVASLLGVCVVTGFSPHRKKADRDTKGARSSSMGSNEDAASHRILGEEEVVVLAPPTGTSPPPPSAPPVTHLKEPKFKLLVTDQYKRRHLEKIIAAFLIVPSPQNLLIPKVRSADAHTRLLENDQNKTGDIRNVDPFFGGETPSRLILEDPDSPSHTSLLTITRFLEALGQQATNEPNFTALRCGMQTFVLRAVQYAY